MSNYKAIEILKTQEVSRRSVNCHTFAFTMIMRALYGSVVETYPAIAYKKLEVLLYLNKNCTSHLPLAMEHLKTHLISYHIFIGLNNRDFVHSGILFPSQPFFDPHNPLSSSVVVEREAHTQWAKVKPVDKSDKIRLTTLMDALKNYKHFQYDVFYYLWPNIDEG